MVGADSWGKLKLQRGGRKGGPSDTFSSSATHYVTSRTVETQTSCHFVSLYVTVLSHQWPLVRAQCPRSWWMIVISKLLASCSTPPHLHISDLPGSAPWLHQQTIKITNTKHKNHTNFYNCQPWQFGGENRKSLQENLPPGFFENFYISCSHTNLLVRWCLADPQFEIYWSQFTRFLCEHSDAVWLCCALCQIFMGPSWEFQ